MPISNRGLALAILASAHAFAAPLLAQTVPANSSAPATAERPVSISDNSFLVEEAYNQEAGVVQHIGNYRRDRAGGWLATFTQEWPARTQRDQLSYTVPLQSAAASSGLGDVVVNYRRQLLGKDDEPVWFSPRVSVALPTGSARKGTGAGGLGLQVNLPLSVQLDRAIVTHWNAGGTLTRARAASGEVAFTRSITAAASAIWLVSPTFNFMLESAWDRTEFLDDDGRRTTGSHFVILPGVRGAINLPSGMQIVPGVGVPLGVGPSSGERGLFLYLSVEHPF